MTNQLSPDRHPSP